MSYSNCKKPKTKKKSSQKTGVVRVGELLLTYGGTGRNTPYFLSETMQA